MRRVGQSSEQLLACLQTRAQVKENESEEERRIRLEMEALAADEAERRTQVRTGGRVDGWCRLRCLMVCLMVARQEQARRGQHTALVAASVGGVMRMRMCFALVGMHHGLCRMHAHNRPTTLQGHVHLQCTHAHAHAHVHTRTHTHTLTCTHVHARAYTRTRTCTCVNLPTCTRAMHMHP